MRHSYQKRSNLVCNLRFKQVPGRVRGLCEPLVPPEQLVFKAQVLFTSYSPLWFAHSSGMSEGDPQWRVTDSTPPPVKSLKVYCRKHKLKCGGTKAVIWERVKKHHAETQGAAHLRGGVASEEKGNVVEGDTPEGSGGFQLDLEGLENLPDGPLAGTTWAIDKNSIRQAGTRTMLIEIVFSHGGTCELLPSGWTPGKNGKRCKQFYVASYRASSGRKPSKVLQAHLDTSGTS